MLAGAAVFLFLFAPSWSAPQEGVIPRNQESGVQQEPLDPSELVGLEALEEYLGTVLEGGDSPLVWVGEEDPSSEERLEVPWKRARYYRRYPWKRQNGRHYDPDGYLCAPSREDVFQLLMALHEARNGNGDRTVNFCNRRRPAKAVFTNIRFLGRR